MILGGNICTFQFSSLYNPVDSRVRESVWKMLLMGVFQRSEMRRHINIYVEENFPSVSKLDASFFLSDVFEFNYVLGNDSSQTFALRPRESSGIGKKSYE